MMKRWSLPALGVIALILAVCPAWVALAPSAQAQPPTPTPATAMLTIEELRVTPDVVVAGDPFAVTFNVWNRTGFFIEQLAVTIKDLDADALLTSTTGAKTTYYNQPGRGILAAIELRLMYASTAAGARRLALGLDYIYYVGGQPISDRLTETLSVQVTVPTPTRTAAPTFTPTAAFTFTPTRTLTPTPTRRPTLAPPTVNYPATQTVLLQTMTAQARPAPSMTPTATRQSPPPPPPPQPRPLPPSRGVVVVEFADVPSLVVAQQVITMTLVVRNVGALEISGVVARFDAAPGAIVPIGRSTQWFLDAIPPGAQYAQAGQFYVASEGPLGQAQVTVTYEDADGAHETTAAINIPVAQPAPVLQPTASPTPLSRGASPVEPWWLRLLRAIFGGGK